MPCFTSSSTGHLSVKLLQEKPLWRTLQRALCPAFPWNPCGHKPGAWHGCFSLLSGAGQLTALGQRSDSYICARKGGTCNLSPCPLYNRIEGTCYRGKAKCCIRWLWAGSDGRGHSGAMWTICNHCFNKMNLWGRHPWDQNESCVSFWKRLSKFEVWKGRQARPQSPPSTGWGMLTRPWAMPPQLWFITRSTGERCRGSRWDWEHAINDTASGPPHSLQKLIPDPAISAACPSAEPRTAAPAPPWAGTVGCGLVNLSIWELSLGP